MDTLEQQVKKYTEEPVSNWYVRFSVLVLLVIGIYIVYTFTLHIFKTLNNKNSYYEQGEE